MILPVRGTIRFNRRDASQRSPGLDDATQFTVLYATNVMNSRVCTGDSGSATRQVGYSFELCDVSGAPAPVRRTAATETATGRAEAAEGTSATMGTATMVSATCSLRTAVALWLDTASPPARAKRRGAPIQVGSRIRAQPFTSVSGHLANQ